MSRKQKRAQRAREKKRKARASMKHRGALPPNFDKLLAQKVREMEAQKAQREKQQGRGRGILSWEMNGFRFVVVGGKTLSSQHWRTFHDFLRAFLHGTFGADWFAAEKLKPEDQQHPVVRWMWQANEDVKRLGEVVGGIRMGPMTGAQRAFLNLAYNLYLIAHHAAPKRADALVKRFVTRLKGARSEFVGALFETYAAASFLTAGFTLEYEDESAGGTSHVEFVAAYPTTGKKFSVEVKARNRSTSEDGEIDDVKRLRVGSKLNAALAKNAAHTRIVMIEVNIPDQATTLGEGWPRAALDQIRHVEQNPDPSRPLFDPAYVLVTNHAFHNNLQAVGAQKQLVVSGHRIPEFAGGFPVSSFLEYLAFKERHAEMLALVDSIKEHFEIPVTFDGSIPELTFSNDGDLPRLRFGMTYLIPTEDGGEEPAMLYDAIVLESRKLVYGTYETKDGKHVMVSSPLTDAELAAWKAHPRTFFGEVRDQERRTETQLEFMEWLFETYQHTPREKLLELMAKAPDIDHLTTLSQRDLAATYCDRIGKAGWARTQKKAVDVPVD